jgi:UDP-N-acetylmuramoyl-tripeptide--D-alanyl-D-alanine ligase
VPLPLLGKHNASNLLTAIAVALGLGLTPEEISQGLQNFKGAEGRSEIKELPGPTRVVCDYYNAQPVSVAAGLELLNQIANQDSSSKIRWACLGDMLELGSEEEKFHRDLAPQIIELAIENVLLCGPRMKALHEELKTRGFIGHLTHFETQSQLAQHLIESMKPRDSVLIKGSRGMRMEEVWKLLEPYAKSHWSPTETG